MGNSALDLMAFLNTITEAVWDAEHLQRGCTEQTGSRMHELLIQA